jgi:hypothetical protein
MLLSPPVPLSRWLALITVVMAAFSRLFAADNADARLMLDVMVNSRPLRLAFDTGADRVIVFRPAAERLGLIITPPPPGTRIQPGETLLSLSEPVELRIGGKVVTDRLGVVELPAGMRPDVDGVVGWQNLRNNVFVFDAARLHLAVESKLPASASSWQKLTVQKSSATLVWEISPVGPNVVAGGILIDTGSPGGVNLAPARLREWRAAHPSAASTLEAYYTPGAGLVVRETFWAEQLTVGPLTLSDVTVQEANVSELAMVENYAATLGLRALSRLNWAVDGTNGTVYF